MTEKLSDAELQNLNVRTKYEKRIELENLRHKHIMEELEFMAKHKIKIFDRMENRVIKNGGKKDNGKG